MNLLSKLSFLALALGFTARADYETGPAFSIISVGSNAYTRPISQSVNLASSNAVGSSILPVTNGGTNASTASAAIFSLGGVHLAGDTMTGSLHVPGLNDSGVAANFAIVTDGSSNLAASSTTSTELGFVHGVTSSIQPQLASLVRRAGDTMTGPLGATVLNAATVNVSGLSANGAIITDGGKNLITVAPGANGNVLTSNGSIWSSQPGSGVGTFVLLAGGTMSGTLAAPTISDTGVISAPLLQTNSNGTLGTATAAGVTTTLGYVPVNKAGDTMSGRLAAPSLLLTGSTSGGVTVAVQPTISSYQMILPSTQGAASTTVLNDGSGHLSWANAFPAVFLNLNNSTASPSNVVYATLNTANCALTAQSSPLTLGSSVYGASSSGWTISSTAVSVPVSGIYHVEADVEIQNPASAANTWAACIYSNDASINDPVSYTIVNGFNPGSSLKLIHIHLVAVTTLIPADSIEMAAITDYSATTATAYVYNFVMYKIGN